MLLRINNIAVSVFTLFPFLNVLSEAPIENNLVDNTCKIELCWTQHDYTITTDFDTIQYRLCRFLQNIILFSNDSLVIIEESLVASKYYDKYTTYRIHTIGKNNCSIITQTFTNIKIIDSVSCWVPDRIRFESNYCYFEQQTGIGPIFQIEKVKVSGLLLEKFDHYFQEKP